MTFREGPCGSHLLGQWPFSISLSQPPFLEGIPLLFFRPTKKSRTPNLTAQTQARDLHSANQKHICRLCLRNGNHRYGHQRCTELSFLYWYWHWTAEVFGFGAVISSCETEFLCSTMVSGEDLDGEFHSQPVSLFWESP